MTDPTDLPEPTNLHGPDDPAMEEALRRALHQRADGKRPSARFNDIQAAATHDRRSRRMYGLIAVAGMLVLVVSIASGIMVNRAGGPVSAAPADSESATTAPPPVPSPSVPPSSTAPEPDEPKPTGKTLDGVPLYWLGGTDSYRLYQEYRTIPDLKYPITSAVTALITQKPTDPDYEAPFSGEGRVVVKKDGNTININMPQESFGESILDPQQAEAALQSVVWTATEAANAPEAEVKITIDGKPGKAWDLVDVGEPITRDQNIRNDIWILQPSHGEKVAAGPFTVSGDSRTFEGTLVWNVIDAKGKAIADGVAAGGANADFGAFSFEVELEPGTYEISVSAEDASGAGNDVIDTKTVIVE